MEVDAKGEYCTVIVTVDGERTVIESVLNHAVNGLDLFQEFEGFIAGATHLSEERDRIVQYLQWSSKEAHEQCMNSPRWDESEASQHFMSLVKDKKVRIKVSTYTVAKEV